MEATLQLNSVTTFLNGDFTEPLETLTENYIRYMLHVREYSPETAESRESYLREFSRYFSERSITSISNAQIDEYFIYLKGRISPLTKRKLSQGSINNRKIAVRMFLTWCKNSQDIPIKVKTTEIFVKRDQDTYQELLEFEDIDYVIRNITHYQDQLIVRLMYEAGLRISELMSVKIEHLRGKKLQVIGKGSKRRTTFISRELAVDLHQWMLDRGWYTGYVFRPNLHGERGEGYKHVDSIRQRIKKWFKKIRGLTMHPHQLRHAYARNLLYGGCSIRAIQKLLGHTNIETTMVYLGVDDDWLEAEYMRAVHHNNSKHKHKLLTI